MRDHLTRGHRFPDLTIHTHDGGPSRLSELAGRYPLIVTFYRGWW